MKRIVFFISFLIMSLMMLAQTDSVFLFPGGVPGVKSTAIPEVKVLRKDGLLRWGHVIDPTLTAFIPEGAGQKTPAVVICPGGGYSILAIESEGVNVAQWFQKRGVAAFVVKYRLPNDKSFDDKRIAPLQDVQQAFKYIRDNAKAYNVDAKNVGVIGFSAGGHLAGTASVLYKYPLIEAKAKCLRPDFSILIYPVITFSDEFCHRGTRNNLIGPEWTKEEQLYYSCETQVDKKTPPTFLLHAKDDPAVPVENSVMYKAALDANGVRNKMVLLETGGHGFGIKDNAKTNVWLNDLEVWLQEMKIIE